jgi:aspartyl protease family protein
MLIMDRRHRIASIALGLLVSTAATALDVNVVGLFPNKAVVQFDGGALQTLSVGQKTRDDIILVSVDRDGATFDIQGRRVVLALGHARQRTSPSATDSVMLPVNEHGHFVVDGQVNGTPIRFVMDTGATFVSLPAREASRLGLDYRKGHKIVMATANGDVSAYRVKLDTVRIGDVAVDNVDAVITEGDSLPVALLGMSFLNHMDIRREGAIMTLTKRY